MTRYTASHWGIYEVATSAPDGAPLLLPLRQDPDPCQIGLHQLDDSLMRLRIRQPAIRRSWLENGPGAAPELRGREPLVEVTWDRALDLVARELRRVREERGNEAIFGGSYGWSSAGRFHHAQSQVHRFLNSIGGYVRHADTYSLGAARVLMPHIVASMDELMQIHTSWDVLAESTGLFVTFGGVPAKNAQIAAGGPGRHRVRDGLRRMAEAGVRFVNISPVRDNLDTGGAVEWLAIRPNTDTALMLALAFVLDRDGLCDRAFLQTHCVGFERFRPYLTGESDGIPKSPPWAEAITGIAADRIEHLAHAMARRRTMINIAWSLQRASHGEQPFWMVVTLAAMLGQIGLPGGGFGVGYGAENTMGSAHTRLRGPTLPQGENKIKAFIPVARIADMLLHPGETFVYNGGRHAYPDIRLIYWAGGNPFHHHQDLNRLMRAWRKPETIVVHEQFWNPLAKFADVVLPATTSMERDDIGYATREGFLVAMRQMIPQVGEARNDFAIFADLARRLGAEGAFTEGRSEVQWLRHLYEVARAQWRQGGVELPDFDDFWERGLIDLGPHDAPVEMFQAFREDPQRHRLDTPSGKIEIFSQRIAGFGVADCAGHPTWYEPLEWHGSGAARRYPLHLLSDQPARRLHSQLDASEYSQAGKIGGREAVHLNPRDAEARGIQHGDVVELFNGRGKCLAAAHLNVDIMAGVARLSTGAWLDPDWERGLDKHGNPNVLTLDVGASGLSQGCSAQTCLVEARRSPTNALDVTAFDLPTLVS